MPNTAAPISVAGTPTAMPGGTTDITMDGLNNRLGNYDTQDPGFFGNNPYRPNPWAFQSRTLDMYGQDIRNRLLDLNNRTPISLDTSQQGQFRSQQMALAQQLAAQANGTAGPSPAQQQLQQATDRNMAQAYAMSAANPNNGAAARNVAYQRGAIQQQSNADAAQLRAQERLAAQNQLGQVLAGARGQDIGVASDQAGIAQQQQSQLDAMTRYYMSAGMSLGQAQMEAQMQFEALKAQSFASASGHSMGATFVGAGSQAAGAAIGAFAASDERIKQNVERLPLEAEPGIPLATFEYVAQPGQRYLGVIAQDVERVSPKDVITGEDGVKRVHPRFAPRPIHNPKGR